MITSTERKQLIIFFPLLFTIISLWNIPHTIAGRYICEGLLLISVLIYRPNWGEFFSTTKTLLIFFAYLVIHLLFFSDNYSIAFSNFRAEWMHFILFSIIGAGTGLILGGIGSDKILLYLGISFSIPLYIHIALSVIKGASLKAIPWGYWGISEIHGDFAYPALEAAILFTVFYLYQAKTRLNKILTIGLLITCILSPLLAASRGGLGFAIASIAFILTSYSLSNRAGKIYSKIKIIQLLIVVIAVLGIFKIALTVDPQRWNGIALRLTSGLEGDPIEIYCKGIKRQTKEGTSTQKIAKLKDQQTTIETVSGDELRMIAARSGFGLMVQHPMGINQSKNAYQTAIAEECKGAPKIFLSHAHNGWIDTSLAIGIPGMLLLLLVIIQYAVLGWNSVKRFDGASPYGLALFGSAIIWALRGLLDSTFRDQMLEMQAFIFAFLLAIVIVKKRGGTGAARDFS